MCATCLHAQNVTTWHVDNARSGVQQNETILTPSNVNSTTFGKLFSFPVQGDVYAEPLYVYQYQMADGNLHNVLIVATEEDIVYAFDADGNNPSQGYLWETSLLGTGETWVTEPDVGVKDIDPNLGVTGTPVIDPVGGVIYVVGRSKTTKTPSSFHQRLHALNLADGTEILNGPTDIAVSLPGTGYGGTTVSFDPLMNNQRPSLLLAPTPSGPTANSVFIAFASNGDTQPYHGWVISYDAANISTQTGAWVDTPNGGEGGIWMTGGGPSSDNAGNIFVGSGNGTFDANSGGGDYGDSEMHLTISNAGLSLADSFTPSDQATLDSGDHDMGMAAPLLLPLQTSGSYTNLLVTADKTGTIYLINADAMGGYLTAQDSSVQDFSVPKSSSGSPFHIHAGFAFFNNTLYVGPDNSSLLAYSFDPNALFTTTPSSQSATEFGCSSCSVSGSVPSVSANNGSNGIVWALDNSQYNNDPAILHAYKAPNLASELYNSTQAANNRDAGGIAIKFTTPTIANGHVYIGGRNTVTAYGLLPSPPTATPTFSPAAGSYVGTQSVSILDGTANASIYYTTDGTKPSVNSTPYGGGTIQVSVSETLSAIAMAPGYTQSAVGQAQYTISATAPPPPNQVEVSLSSVANLIGIVTDGTKYTSASLNGSGCDYSANQLGNPLSYAGIDYAIGTANKKNVVKGGKSVVIPLTSGEYSSLNFLALAVGANQKTPQVFTVTYSDKSTSKFSQSISDWTTPQHYAKESIANAMSYCDAKAGTETKGTHDLYQYSFTINSEKTVKSLTLPSNSDVIVVAVTLTPTN